MSALATARTATLSTSFFSRFVALLSGWNDARVTRKALGRLSDRELDDIGLCRADIESLFA